MEKKPTDFRNSLSMIDSVGHRRFIIPAEVKGYFQSKKKWIHIVFLFIFISLPWIQINGEQAVLLNIGARMFHFFGLQLLAHDAPLIFFVLLALTLGLALLTALFGRAWCGWACPQTVFIEGFFRRIEIWTEGTYIKRRRLQVEEWKTGDYFRAVAKWTLYFVTSVIISHSFLAYWTGGQELMQMMGSGPKENGFYFLLVMGMTGLILFNFGWFREQFCLIVCPYGKIQSVLMDSNSVTVMYDEKRGEPRKGEVAKGGDCVSCNRCVQVCPTGIDIRNGIQMECIGCTACIDACDEIMVKVKKPKGLIRYKALTDKPVKWFRLRVVLYSAVLVFSILGLTISLLNRTPFRVEVLRARDVPYIIRIDSGINKVQNRFLIRLENDRKEDLNFSVSASYPELKLILPENPIVIKAQTKRDIPLFIEISQGQFKNQSLDLIIQTGEEKIQKTIQILEP